jgi:heme exporter protein C
VKNVDRAFIALTVATAIVVVTSIHWIFLKAPLEESGIVQKIFYFHVPAAYAMYVGAAFCCVGSIGYLWTEKLGWDSVARAGADVAVAMGLIVLTTGPLWAAKSWGTYWKWDPRITTSLLSVLIYIAYVVMRAFTGGGDGERKFAAALGILGAANLPIIHYAVRKWGGTHPEVITGKGGGLHHPDFVRALLLGFAAFTLLSIVLVWLRVRQDLLANRIEAAEEDALATGAVED